MRGFCLEVAGEYACFTRPEMKVERVSYDVITPSAARAIFSAIFWKPAIKWHVTKIEVLNPIRWTSVRRNEVKAVAAKNPFFIEDSRLQRAGLILRDVKYRLHAEFEFIPPALRPKAVNPAPDWLSEAEERELLKQSEAARLDEKPAKYAAMFDRRASRGQYFMHPYLGCREFSCSSIRLVKDFTQEPAPIPESRDFGFMLYDLDFADPKDIKPMFYRAEMKNGVILVPVENSEEVRK